MELATAATYYRTGLLLGLLRGDEVHRWAERRIARDPDPPHALLDLVLVSPGDLSALRHALYPMSVEPEPEPVLEAMFALLHADLEAGRRGLPDTLTVLRQMRSMLRLPPRLYGALNATLVEHARIGVPSSPVPDWLRQFAGARLEPLQS